jgi:IMP dehydrogenase
MVPPKIRRKIKKNGGEMSFRSFKESLSFDDVLLVPKYSNIESRKQVDIGSTLDEGLGFSFPVISSPMDTITEKDMAVALHKAGGFGIIHRYNTINQQAEVVKKIQDQNQDIPVAVAIGATGDYIERAERMVMQGAKILCIDIAHGHHVAMERSLKTLKDSYGTRVHIMAGNVATLEGFNALSEWGADSIRVGIGGGSICSTRLVTGHGIPTLESVMECARSTHSARIIADGGIKTSGDIVKALAAGADFVMVGSLLAGTRETPGNVFTSKEGKKYKIYRGMASSKAQTDWRGKSSTPEGVSTTVPYKGEVASVLDNLLGGIRSGFSYSGVRTLKELHAKAKFIRQTPAGQFESSTHIMRR